MSSFSPVYATDATVIERTPSTGKWREATGRLMVFPSLGFVRKKLGTSVRFSGAIAAICEGLDVIEGSYLPIDKTQARNFVNLLRINHLGGRNTLRDSVGEGIDSLYWGLDAIDEMDLPPCDALDVRHGVQNRFNLGITHAQDICAELVHTSRRAWQQWEAGDREMHNAFLELAAIKARSLSRVPEYRVTTDDGEFLYIARTSQLSGEQALDGSVDHDPIILTREELDRLQADERAEITRDTSKGKTRYLIECQRKSIEPTIVMVG